MNKSKFIYIILSVLLVLNGCNRTSNKDVVNYVNDNIKKYNLIQQLETDHFKFYSNEQDKACIKDLSDTLEDNYTRITKDLSASLSKKVTIYIYSDLSTFHEAINQPGAPSWVVGTSFPLGTNTIQIVNPSNADGRPYSDFMKVITHEFTHVVIESISADAGSMPIWLNEGVATFEADQYEGVNEVIGKAKLSNQFPSLKDLEGDVNNFGNNNGYLFSYSIITFIVKTYGYDKLVELIKTPSEFEKILGVSKEDFQNKWIAYVR